MKWTIRNIDELPAAAKEFISQIGNKRVFALRGEMGAGKTTFIKSVCEALGVKDVINSPTFAIVNEYRSENDAPIYHFDFYRIRKIEEAFDFGYEEYIYSDAICFIEWPELIEELLPQDCTNVHIDIQNDGARIIHFDD
ncbi:MAG: tRNA (adenosine(37)-N6)-threonylcarbamoyltransferase complex ATPase subunit type 1 TsaE [Bacteroidales bacterium]|nr:tRNA (adenosine(37)-N6)-threonylcarbamoyltransferase complex ATPase subunit type 1 TsaE [Bacteroidales bacterium]